MDPRLFLAAKKGDISLLHEVIQAQPAEQLLDNITEEEDNVLHIAVRPRSQNSKVFIKHVIGQCPSILAQKNSTGEIPLHTAAKIGLLEMIYFLIQCSVDVKVSEDDSEELRKMKLLLDNYPLLYDLEKGGPLRALPHILQAYPLSLYSDSVGLTALHLAIVARNTGEVREWVKTFPEMIERKDKNGWTSLHYASYYGLSGSVRILLANDKFCAYEANENGRYGHHIAASPGHESVIKVLYQHCPDCFELLDNEGRTALQVAMEARKYRVASFLENEVGEARKNRNDEFRRLKEKATIHLLVVTIIATVCFAAGSNIPGGFIVGGQNEGMAALKEKAAFQVFVISNSVAFCCSVASIAFHFIIIFQRQIMESAVLLVCGLFLTFVGLMGLVTAFISATIAVLAAAPALWVASSIVGCFVLLVFTVIITLLLRNRIVSVDDNKIQPAEEGQVNDSSVSANRNEVHGNKDERPGFLSKIATVVLSATPS